MSTWLMRVGILFWLPGLIGQPGLEVCPRPKEPEVEIGQASWYGGVHEGRRTANGEIFRMRKFTAAHKSLPMGTIVRVTSLRTGRSVVVRINDRGPYMDRRVIDLSRGAAEELGVVRRGLEPVRVEQIATSSGQSDRAEPARLG